MNLLDVMRRLYCSQISCGFQSERAGGVRVWLGDGHNKRKAEQWFGINEFEQAATWLDQEACLYYPDSDYARGRSTFALISQWSFDPADRRSGNT
jgi:hypothetical protein